MSINQKIESIIMSPKQSILLILIVIVLTHLPTNFGSFIADDYMQWAMLEGSSDLASLGFSKADPGKALEDKLLESFHFFNPVAGTNEAYRNYGNLPWWSSNNASMVPFRPVAALSHWVDYTVFGKTLQFHRLHSLLYFLLLGIAAYFLYTKISTKHAVAVFVVLLLVVDFSLTKSFNWVIARNSYMACAIGIFSISAYIRWRCHGKTYDLLLSLFLLGAAILTAEAAISAIAYMGAYTLCVEKHDSIIKKIPPLIPFVVLIVLWRILYSSAGFGSNDIGQYVDPGRSPVAFLVNFLEVFPLVCISLITGIDSLVVMIHPEKRLIVSVVGWVVSLGCVFFIWPTLKESRTARFMFVGSIVAAIPGTALISGESRTVTFSSIGFFYLLALWLVTLYGNRSSFLSRWGFRLTILWHLVLPALLAVFLTSNVSGFSQQSKQYESVPDGVETKEYELVIVNDSSAMFYYLPFEWAFRGFKLPARLNVLTPGLNTVDITRESERLFIISTPAGMPIHHKANIDSLSGDEPVVGAAYSGLFALGFFTTPEQTPAKGEVILNSDMKITIVEENLIGPTKITVEFIGKTSPDQKVWQRFDWSEYKYKVMQPLSINETRRIIGPLD
ncbi:hypothetical protein A9Q99_02185 [Gammaproteobacteria bacterium 45_16_T64]|nr:hypothetical protein A9Q99_02185 [Gammaproteobacteria bacterium 45_16_T64]